MFASNKSTGSATITELRSRASRFGEMLSSRWVANNTLEAKYTDGSRIIMLHNTPIITLCKNGDMVINTGGYNSHTTRNRLNEFLPAGYRVYTENAVIHINNVPFLQTVTIKSDGTILPDVNSAELLSDRNLIDRFMAHIRKHGLPSLENNGGDPWCVTFDVGETVMRDWLSSLYFTRTMYMLAMQFAGISDTGIAYYMMEIERNKMKLDMLSLRRVRCYIRSQIGFAR